MVHHYKQTVIRVILSIGLLNSIIFAKDIPILKTVEINVPLKEYSIVDFPFKLKDVQFNTFTYKTKITKRIIKSKPSNKPGITLSKKGKIIQNKKVIKPKKDILGLTKGINVLTFKPKHIGFAEMIIWGYADFPIILKVNVVEPEYADKYLKFVEVLDKKINIRKFESSGHEKIVELMTKHLYDEDYKSKPSGYQSVVRKDTYDVEIKNDDGKIIAVVRNTLIRELVGRDYLGQVWNVNLIGFYRYEKVNKDINDFYAENNNDIERIDMKKIFYDVPNNLEVTLYEELFDEKGIFSVSLETYGITKDHGTRVMIVRGRN